MTDFDCRHSCCDERRNPNHDHFLSPRDCSRCSVSAGRDEWMRDVLTALSAVAHGYTVTPDSAARVLDAVPAEYRRAAGLAVLAIEGAPSRTLAQALGHDDPDGTCDICVKFRTEMEAIRESERQAWIKTKDVIIGD